MEVVREIELPNGPDEVWEALTEPDELERWLAPAVELDARPGGEGRFRFADGETRLARVEAVEPGRLLELRWWRVDGSDETVVAIALQPLELGTRVVVTERALGPR